MNGIPENRVVAPLWDIAAHVESFGCRLMVLGLSPIRLGRARGDAVSFGEGSAGRGLRDGVIGVRLSVARYRELPGKTRVDFHEQTG